METLAVGVSRFADIRSGTSRPPPLWHVWLRLYSTVCFSGLLINNAGGRETFNRSLFRTAGLIFGISPPYAWGVKGDPALAIQRNLFRGDSGDPFSFAMGGDDGDPFSIGAANLESVGFGECFFFFAG